MPVEIRELIIRTEITTAGKPVSQLQKDKQMEKLKRQLLYECKKMMMPAAKRSFSKR